MNRQDRRAAQKTGRPPAHVPTTTAVVMGKALNAAVAALQRGRLQEAERQLDRADALVPGDADVLQLRGAVALRRRDYEGAVRLIGQALKHDPNQPAALNNLGEAYRELGQPDEAIEQLEKALHLAPREPRVLYNLGNAHRDKGEAMTAIACFREAVAADQGMVEATNNLGSLLAEAGLLEEAEAAMRRAVRLRPRDEALKLQLGNVLMRRKKFEAAAEAYESALALDAGNTEAMAELGRALHGAGRSAEGIAYIERALTRDPEAGLAHFNLGIIHAEMGDFDAAEAELRACLACAPRLTMAWFQLAEIRRLGADETDVPAIEAALADESCGGLARVHLHFALGRARDRAKDYAAAFAQYKAGNDLRRRYEPFPAEAAAAEFEARVAAFTPALFEAKAGFGAEAEGPIFIVGMPRSGTTLAEQILASHEQVFGAGELPTMGEIANELPALAGQPEAGMGAVAALDRAQAGALAERYLETIAKLSGGARFVTDKTPGNFANLGLIALLLPQARIVHCTRDPMDVALSCYVQNFETGQSFANDLEAIALYYGYYRRFMAHWATVLPIPIVRFDYEAVVADPETRIRAFVTACGLDWDARCLRFNETARPVVTASRWQARQPLYGGSVGAWRRFEKQLAPLKAAIEAQDSEGAAVS
jgi:tetratricopeptide (TPR) repeat protein